MKSMNTNSTATESQEVIATEAAHVPAHVPAHAPAHAPAQATAVAAPPAAASPRALLKQLQQQFTAFRQCLPLEIGIDKQLLGRMPGLDRKTMRAALGIHTGSLRYLKAMEKATVRYDLDGKPGAEVTDTHRAHAKEARIGGGRRSRAPAPGKAASLGLQVFPHLSATRLPA
jgi:ProP effector